MLTQMLHLWSRHWQITLVALCVALAGAFAVNILFVPKHLALTGLRVSAVASDAPPQAHLRRLADQLTSYEALEKALFEGGVMSRPSSDRAEADLLMRVVRGITLSLDSIEPLTSEARAPSTSGTASGPGFGVNLAYENADPDRAVDISGALVKILVGRHLLPASGQQMPAQQPQAGALPGPQGDSASDAGPSAEQLKLKISTLDRDIEAIKNQAQNGLLGMFGGKSAQSDRVIALQRSLSEGAAEINRLQDKALLAGRDALLADVDEQVPVPDEAGEPVVEQTRDAPSVPNPAPVAVQTDAAAERAKAAAAARASFAQRYRAYLDAHATPQARQGVLDAQLGLAIAGNKLSRITIAAATAPTAAEPADEAIIGANPSTAQSKATALSSASGKSAAAADSDDGPALTVGQRLEQLARRQFTLRNRLQEARLQLGETERVQTQLERLEAEKRDAVSALERLRSASKPVVSTSDPQANAPAAAAPAPTLIVELAEPTHLASAVMTTPRTRLGLSIVAVLLSVLLTPMLAAALRRSDAELEEDEWPVTAAAGDGLKPRQNASEPLHGEESAPTLRRRMGAVPQAVPVARSGPEDADAASPAESKSTPAPMAAPPVAPEDAPAVAPAVAMGQQSLYGAHFGLHEKPFALLPDPRFLYWGKHHRSSFAALQYSLHNQAGFTVLSGEIGCGKTTLLRHLLNEVDDSVTVGLLSNLQPGYTEILDWILNAYGLETRSDSKAEQHQRFVDFLIEQYSKKRRCVLIVDEAQNMSIAALEELRMLSNINADEHLLLQLILVGQPEVRGKLARPELTQFAQRIAVNFHLHALTLVETGEYIQHRLSRAGGNPQLFAPQTYQRIYEVSRGVPRVINVLCETALVYAYAANRTEVDAEIIEEVIAEREAATRPRAEPVYASDPGSRRPTLVPVRSAGGGLASAAMREENHSEPVSDEQFDADREFYKDMFPSLRD